MKKNLSLLAVLAVVFFALVWAGFIELSALPVFVLFAVTGIALRYSIYKFHDEVSLIHDVFGKPKEGYPDEGIKYPAMYVQVQRDYTAIIIAAMVCAALMGGIFAPRAVAQPISQHMGDERIQPGADAGLVQPSSESSSGQFVLRLIRVLDTDQAQGCISNLSRRMGKEFQSDGEYRREADLLRQSAITSRMYSGFHAPWRWRSRRVLLWNSDKGRAETFKALRGEYQQAGNDRITARRQVDRLEV